MSGYTKSFRSKWEHPIFRDLQEAGVWAWLCDSATWKDTRVNYCGIMVELKRGQIITSRSFIAKGFNLGEQKVRSLLARLEKDCMINQQPTSHGTIITICNYEKYQPQQPADNQPHNQPLTSDQPATNQNKKEVKEVKERKKNIYTPDFEEFWTLYPNPDDKAGTFKKYLTALKETDHETIINGVKRYITANPWGDNIKYCRHSTTWLNKKSWNTQYDPPQPSSGQPSQHDRPARGGQSSYERGIMASLAGAKHSPDEF